MHCSVIYQPGLCLISHADSSPPKVGKFFRITDNALMNLLIWIFAIVLLGFWSVLAWLSHKLLQWAGQLPWEQTLQQVKELPVPALIAPWWQQLVDVLAPLLQVTQGIMDGLTQFAGAALPFLVGAVWLFGAMIIVTLAVIASGGVWWARRKRVSQV